MCGMSLVLVRDVLALADQRRVPVVLLSLDQEKAFYLVSHAFLFVLLERLGFGPNFIAIIKKLYTGAISHIAINGYLSEPIVQQGGVRQGCPLSSMLYVLYLEPLVEWLRGDPVFQGIHIPGAGKGRATVTMYADDATLFLGWDEDFCAVSQVLEAFSGATGARVNRSKSSVLYAGAWGGRTEITGGFSLCQEGLKILGVVF